MKRKIISVMMGIVIGFFLCSVNVLDTINKQGIDLVATASYAGPKPVTVSATTRSDNGCKAIQATLTIPAGRMITKIKTAINPNGFLPCYGAKPVEKVGYQVKGSSGKVIWKEAVFWKGGEEGGPPKTLAAGTYTINMVSFGRNTEATVWVTYQ